MMVNSSRVNITGMALKHGNFLLNTKAFMKTAKDMVKVNSYGRTKVVMMETSSQIRDMAKVSMCGLRMVLVFIKASGCTIGWKAKVPLYGVMDVDTPVLTFPIKNTATKVPSNGQTAENTQEPGNKVNNTEKVHFISKMVSRNLVIGKWVNW